MAASFRRLARSAPRNRVSTRDPTKFEFRIELHFLSMDFQDRFATANVRKVHGDFSVEPARTGKRAIQHVRAICRSDDDNARALIEASISINSWLRV
jgi:hypothetical protein